ncbi:hypothetical protein H5410_028306 [Solanum commersonii]|uniref:Amino acid transporter transmembrane domain-containing protein n=1 Tax=Solanum commersonii TaxID=4109 RepID=A0A9J5Z738_SOLCO|nr:hypothetical protein H5410_028306 [Solanum commersonii]
MADRVLVNLGDESTRFDDDGRLKRSGSVWTASAHIITAVIGSGVLSLAWATAQLGWIAAPTVLLLFSFVTYTTCTFLSDCYRTGDQVTGRSRNYTYMDVVRANLGDDALVRICGTIQYVNLFGAAIGYIITSSISMAAITKSNCFRNHGHDASCNVSTTVPYMIIFGVMGLILSQIPDFDNISLLSVAAVVMSFTYTSIVLGLGVAQTGKIQGSLTGIISTGNEIDKIWKAFKLLKLYIAFTHSYSLILIEIQDTLKSRPEDLEAKTMKKATLISVAVTTVLYMLCGCFGYAAFGDESPQNLLTGFDNPYSGADPRCIEGKFITKEINIPIPGCKCKTFKLNFFRLVFVITTTLISMLMPFFNNVVVDILGAFEFWPLTVYFPIEMYIVKHNIPKWSDRWICLQLLSGACLVISIAAVVGSFARLVSDLKVYKPFK